VNGRTYNRVILNAIGLAPSIHDPCVVERNDSNGVDPFALELLELVNVGWNVVGLAGWGESAGNCHNDDLLVRPLYTDVSRSSGSRDELYDRWLFTFACVIVCGYPASRDIGILWGVRDVGEGNSIRELVANFKLRHLYRVFELKYQTIVVCSSKIVFGEMQCRNVVRVVNGIVRPLREGPRYTRLQGWLH
jgi:hypothetical protein